MNSLLERMTTLKSIEIDSDEDFVLKIKHKNFNTEVLIRVMKMEFSPENGLKEISILALNPNNDSMTSTSITNT